MSGNGRHFDRGFKILHPGDRLYGKQYRKDDLSVREEVLNETRRGSTVRGS